MAKRNRQTTPTSIVRKVKEGRGRGEGKDYVPWLKTQDVPSQGTSIRIMGWKTGRIHHLMSRGEYFLFLWLEWLLTVLDIREQFPLEQETTVKIADKLGIKHPTDPTSHVPIIMTTDFNITMQNGEEKKFVARTFKNSGDLKKQRNLEKLEIERVYWEDIKQTEWAIVTEKQLPMVLIKNVECVHDHFRLEGCDLNEDQMKAIKQILSERVRENGTPLRHIALDCDKRLGLEPGTSLSMAYHLIATRQWIIDMNIPLEPAKPLNVLEFVLED